MGRSQASVPSAAMIFVRRPIDARNAEPRHWERSGIEIDRYVPVQVECEEKLATDKHRQTPMRSDRCSSVPHRWLNSGFELKGRPPYSCFIGREFALRDRRRYI